MATLSPVTNEDIFDQHALRWIQQEVDAGRDPSTHEDLLRCYNFCQQEQYRIRSEFVLEQHRLDAEHELRRFKPAALALILGLPAIWVGGTWRQMAICLVLLLLPRDVCKAGERDPSSSEEPESPPGNGGPVVTYLGYPME